jgi:hypothetical protein
MRRALLCGLTLAIITGCAPAADDRGEGAPSYPAAQAWALDDGAVTDEEYRRAIDGFAGCVRGAGFPVADAVLSPVDGLTLLYGIPPTGDPDAWSKAVEDCNLAHISHVEPVYVEAREQKMTPELREATARCLRDKRVRVAGTERNVREFVDAGGKSPEVMECVSASTQRLYPELPGFLRIRW